MFSPPLTLQKLLLLYAHKCPITEFSSAIASFFLRKGGCVRGKDSSRPRTSFPGPTSAEATAGRRRLFFISFFFIPMSHVQLEEPWRYNEDETALVQKAVASASQNPISSPIGETLNKPPEDMLKQMITADRRELQFRAQLRGYLFGSTEAIERVLEQPETD